jgi:hypothetical protein
LCCVHLRACVRAWVAGAGRRDAWYEATIMLEAVRLQWFSLCFAQPEEMRHAISALRRVVDLGFYLGTMTDGRRAACRGCSCPSCPVIGSPCLGVCTHCDPIQCCSVCFTSGFLSAQERRHDG